jgi:hypothetical protein
VLELWALYLSTLIYDSLTHWLSDSLTLSLSLYLYFCLSLSLPFFLFFFLSDISRYVLVAISYVLFLLAIYLHLYTVDIISNFASLSSADHPPRFTFSLEYGQLHCYPPSLWYENVSMLAVIVFVNRRKLQYSICTVLCLCYNNCNIIGGTTLRWGHLNV